METQMLESIRRLERVTHDAYKLQYRLHGMGLRRNASLRVQSLYFRAHKRYKRIAQRQYRLAAKYVATHALAAVRIWKPPVVD